MGEDERFNQTKIGLKPSSIISLTRTNLTRFNQTKIGLKHSMYLVNPRGFCPRFNQTKIGLKPALQDCKLQIVEDLIRLK